MAVQFYVDGKQVTQNSAWKALWASVENACIDPDEVAAIWDRALSSEEDGEYGRDDLAAICDNIEIVV